MDRKSLSLQTVVETVVQEIQRLLVVHPMLVLATKSAAFGDKQSITEVIRLDQVYKIPRSSCWTATPSLVYLCNCRFYSFTFVAGFVPEKGPMRRHRIQEVLKINHIVVSCHPCGRYDLIPHEHDMTKLPLQNCITHSLSFHSNLQSFVSHRMLLRALGLDQLTLRTYNCPFIVTYYHHHHS